MKNIVISPKIKTRCPDLRLGCVLADVDVKTENPQLWERIHGDVEKIREQLSDTSAIALLPAIKETRQGYKSCGKDPARYRPSAESLLRRVVQGKGLYQVNNVVDLLNLVSIRSGFSIGGYDVAKIESEAVLGIGEAREIYEGIGRGVLNIEYLPVLRDQLNAFGSPTSDSERTSVKPDTKQFLMVFFAFGKTADLEAAMQDAEDLLRQFGGSKNIEKTIVD